MVRWRWPGERLLITVPCDAEWQILKDEWGHEGKDLGATSEIGRVVGSHVEPGVLGITQARVVYHDRRRPGTSPRVASTVFLALAIIGLISGGPLALPVASAIAAIAFWIAGRIVETLGVGHGAFEFQRIVELDPAERRIHGVDPWGVHYRLRLGPDDFESVVQLLPRAA